MYKHSHTLTHRQPEKYPNWRPSELRCIHTSELLSIHRKMVHTSMLRCIDHPYIGGSIIVHTSEDGPYQNPYIGGWSIHWNSDVWTIQTSELLSIHQSAIHYRSSNVRTFQRMATFIRSRKITPLLKESHLVAVTIQKILVICTLFCGYVEMQAQMVKQWTVEWEVPG